MASNILPCFSYNVREYVTKALNHSQKWESKLHEINIHLSQIVILPNRLLKKERNKFAKDMEHRKPDELLVGVKIDHCANNMESLQNI